MDFVLYLYSRILIEPLSMMQCDYLIKYGASVSTGSGLILSCCLSCSI